MSQPAASQQIAALEASLGVELVERGTRPVQLTEPDAALVRHVRAVLARLDNAGQELAEITGRRTAGCAWAASRPRWLRSSPASSAASGVAARR